MEVASHVIARGNDESALVDISPDSYREEGKNLDIPQAKLKKSVNTILIPLFRYIYTSNFYLCHFLKEEIRYVGLLFLLPF
jgi:hypothetical protein